MADVNATTSIDSIVLSTGDDTLTISDQTQIQGGDLFDGGDGTDIIFIAGAGDALGSPVTLDMSGLGVDATHGLHNFEWIMFANSSGTSSVTLDGDQLGAGLLPANLVWIGSPGGQQSITVKGLVDGIVDTSGWTFVDWNSPGVNFTTSFGAETIYGTSLADTIGMSNWDTFYGGGGNDRIYAITAAATQAEITIDGGSGDDAIELVGGSFTGTIEGGEGTDTLTVSPAVNSPIGTIALLTVTGVENLVSDFEIVGSADQFEAFDHIGLTADSSQTHVRITLNAAGTADLADELDGVDASFRPWSGGNTILSGNGDDIFAGGSSTTFYGGGGNDHYNAGGGVGTSNTAGFSGAWTDYAITLTGSTYTVVDLREGSPDGTDTVDNFAYYQFSNGTFSYSEIINHAPTDVALSAMVVAEGATAGTEIGILSATDADVSLGDMATFSLVDDAGGRFAITGNNLVVADTGLLDYEAATSHDVTVRVTDAHGLTYDETFTITLTDQNDTAPVITTAATQVVAENTTFVATLTATDVDTVGTSPATFAIVGGADAALFEIVDGDLAFVSPRDYETDPHSYEVTVRASDGTNSTDRTIIVTLADQNEHVGAFLDIHAGIYNGAGPSSGDTYGYAWEDLLTEVVANGTLEVGSGSAIHIVSGALSLELVIHGVNLASDGSTLTGDAITGFELLEVGEEGTHVIVSGGGYGTPVSPAAFQALLDDPGDAAKFDAVFLPEGMEISTVGGGEVPNSAFDDMIRGSAASGGSDFLYSGPGNDTIDGGNPIDGDYDILSYGAAGGTMGIVVNFSEDVVEGLHPGQVRDEFGSVDTVSNVEVLRGSGFADIFYLTAYGEFRGGAGDDVFNVQPYGDVGPDMTGGAGSDTFNLTGSSPEQTISYDAEPGDHESWDPEIDHGVIVNLSGEDLTGIVIPNLGPQDLAAHRALDTFGDIDVINSPTGGGVRIETTDAGDYIRGSDKPSTLERFEGRGGDDVIYGGDGWEALLGGAGDDALYGGDGGAWFDPGRGADIVVGGAGVDTLQYDDDVWRDDDDYDEGIFVAASSGFVIDPWGDVDEITGIDNFYGTRFADTFMGSTADEVFLGLAGNDAIYGGGDLDMVLYRLEQFASRSDAYVGVVVNFGGDPLTDESVDDLLAGFGITGVLAGWDFNVAASSATDTFGDTDTLYNIGIIGGTDARDVIFGSISGKLLIGYGGDDILVGGSVVSTLNNAFVGGSGNDIIIGRSLALGPSVVVYELETRWGSGLGGDLGYHGVIVNLSGETLYGQIVEGLESAVDVGPGEAIDSYGDRDTLVNIQGIHGTEFQDIVVGGEHYGELQGYGGNDMLTAGSGGAALAGGDGDDVLDGSAGSSDFYGGRGDDTIIGGGDYDRLHYDQDDSERGIVVNLSAASQTAGDDTVASGEVLDNYGDIDAVSGIDHIDGTAHGDAFFTGDEGYVTLVGHDGADTFVVNGTASVELIGGDGADTFDLSFVTDYEDDREVVIKYGYEQGLQGYDYPDDGGDLWGAGAWAGKHGVIVNLAGSEVQVADFGGLGTVTVGALSALDTYGATDTFVAATSGTVHVVGTDARDYIRGHDGSDVSEWFEGGAGDDTLIAGDGGGELHGQDGDDRLEGGAGDEFLYGGEGDDDIKDGAGSDWVYGGDGDDHVTASADADGDIIFGGSGVDTVHYGEAPLSITANDDADWTTPNVPGWTIEAADGSFDNLLGVEIIAYGGVRYLLVGSGALTLEEAVDLATEAGDTFVFADPDEPIAVDKSTSETSFNMTFTGSAPVAVATGSGGDYVKSGSGDDNVSTGEGGDTIYTGDGNDIVDAGNGDDTIIGGSGNGNDFYDGGEGSGDTLILSSATNGVTVDLVAIGRSDTVLRNADGAGGAPDTIGELLVGAGKSADLAVGIADGEDIGTDAVIGFENVIGGAGNDTITGDDAANALSGADGDDHLYGGIGDDILSGGAGSDVLHGGAGSGDTALFSGDWADYDITEESGTFTITDNRDGSPDGTDTVTGVETFKFANSATAFNASDILNDAPTDIALSAATVAEGATAGTVIGTLSATDLDTALGDTTTFSIVGSDGRFDIVDGQLVVLDGSLLDYETAEDHSVAVTIRVTDAHGETFDKELSVSLTDINDNAPVITTVASQSIAEGQTVVATLASTDADGVGTNPATFSIVGGADQALFGISGGNLVFLAARDYETQAHSYQVTVRANDGTNQTDKTITVALTDINDNAPVITTVASQSIAEGQTLVATLASTDVDGVGTNPATFSIVGGADQALFGISGGNLVLLAARDYETQAHSYQVTVRAYDGSNNTDKTITVALTDANDNAPVITTVASQSVAENQTVVATLASTDADGVGTNPATFSIVGGADQALFGISGGNLVFLAARDYETQAHSYQVTVRAYDGTNQTDKTITVALTDANDNAPVITTVASQSVAENQTLVATLASTDADGVGTNPATFSIVGGADQALFGISGGNLVFLTARDYETQAHSYQVTVRAYDGVNQTDKAITVALTDVNEAPIFTSGGSASVAENTPASVIVYDANAVAPEAGTLTYALAGVDAARFSIDGATGEVRFKAPPDYEAPTDAGADNAYQFIVRASDGVNTVDRAVTLSVTDVAEGQPSSGNDVLSGSPGADMLNGGLGNDLLTGKSGSDTFAFNTKLHKTKNVDHITDFEVGIDTIQLDRSIVKKLKVGDLKAKAFTAGKVKGDDRIIYDKKNGDLFYDVDGKGGKKAVKFAILDNHPDNLSADDFTIVA